MLATIASCVFWLCAAAIIYSYVGYPLLLFAFSSCAQAGRDLRFLMNRHDRRCASLTDWPRVAILIAAFNEEEVIESKLRNTEQLTYPKDRLEVLLGLDAPTDATAERVRLVPMAALRLFDFPTRRGKLAVLRDLSQQTKADILLFTDANTVLNSDCVLKLVRHFNDPRVGAVSGEEIRRGGKDCSGESLYWRFESAIKVLESRLNCSLGANGAIYAVRRELFHPSPSSLVEDLELPLKIRFSGSRVIYDPEAIGIEDIVPDVKAQFQRRARLGAGNYQTLFENPGYSNPFKGPPAFAFISHRLLRWLGPFLLVAAFLANCVAVGSPFYSMMLVCHALFYLAAAIGYWQSRNGKSSRAFALPFQFCLMNASYVAGFLRYLRGRQEVAWQVTPRKASTVLNATHKKSAMLSFTDDVDKAERAA
jgi:cellulose synthase/poly-beta-1,6-N-acetylglucosamine synthase-like glycosyltransferase